MRLTALLAVLLLIGMVSASYVCDRIAISDTYCNEDGSRTAVIYSAPVNVFTGFGYQPFEDVTSLEYKGDHFELTYQDKTSTISIFTIVDGKETEVKDTELKVEPVIIKQRGGFEYGVILDNADKVEAFGFRIGGDEIKGIVYDFSDTITENTSLEMVDPKTALVRNTKAAKQLLIDPTITFNESNNGNIGDSYTGDGVPTSNYGSGEYAVVQSKSGDNKRAWVAFSLNGVIPYGATITNANLSVYMFGKSAAGAADRTWVAYNTTSFNESTITWNNQPALGTQQSTIATGTTYPVWRSWTVTNAVLAKVNSDPQNIYFVIADSSEGSATAYGYIWVTKENTTDTTKRPQLYVTYTPNCPLSSISILVNNENTPASNVTPFSLTISNSTSTVTIERPYFNTDNCPSNLPVRTVTISLSNSSFYSPRNYYAYLTPGGSYSLATYLIPISNTYEKFVAFFVSGAGGNAISGAVLTVQKQISGSWVTVGQGTTDSSGAVGFWLWSTTNYEIIVNATGYNVVYAYLTPVSNTEYITLGANYSSGFGDMFQSVNYTLTPVNRALQNGSNYYSFSFTISSLSNNLSYFRMNISNSSGSVISSQSSTTAAGGTLTNSTVNVSANGGVVNVTLYWLALNYSSTPYITTVTYRIYGTPNMSYVSLQNITGPGGSLVTSGLGIFTLELLALIITIMVTGAVAKRGDSLPGAGLVFMAVMSLFLMGIATIYGNISILLKWLGMLWFGVAMIVYRWL